MLKKGPRKTHSGVRESSDTYISKTSCARVLRCLSEDAYLPFTISHVCQTRTGYASEVIDAHRALVVGSQFSILLELMTMSHKAFSSGLEAYHRHCTSCVPLLASMYTFTLSEMSHDHPQFRITPGPGDDLASPIPGNDVPGAVVCSPDGNLGVVVTQRRNPDGE